MLWSGLRPCRRVKSRFWCHSRTALRVTAGCDLDHVSLPEPICGLQPPHRFEHVGADVVLGRALATASLRFTASRPLASSGLPRYAATLDESGKQKSAPETHL